MTMWLLYIWALLAIWGVIHFLTDDDATGRATFTNRVLFVASFPLLVLVVFVVWFLYRHKHGPARPIKEMLTESWRYVRHGESLQ